MNMDVRFYWRYNKKKVLITIFSILSVIVLVLSIIFSCNIYKKYTDSDSNDTFIYKYYLRKVGLEDLKPIDETLDGSTLSIDSIGNSKYIDYDFEYDSDVQYEEYVNYVFETLLKNNANVYCVTDVGKERYLKKTDKLSECIFSVDKQNSNVLYRFFVPSKKDESLVNVIRLTKKRPYKNEARLSIDLLELNFNFFEEKFTTKYVEINDDNFSQYLKFVKVVAIEPERCEVSISFKNYIYNSNLEVELTNVPENLGFDKINLTLIKHNYLSGYSISNYDYSFYERGDFTQGCVMIPISPEVYEITYLEIADWVVSINGYINIIEEK